MQDRGYRPVFRLIVCLLLLVFSQQTAAMQTAGGPQELADGTGTKPAPSPQLAQCRLFREMARELENPLEQVQALLGAAECSLARECAEPLSVLWSGDVVGRAEAAQHLILFAKRASKDLAQATKILDARRETDGDDADVIRRRRERVETLEAFATMFDAIGSAISAGVIPTTQPASHEDARKKLISACHGLAPCLDTLDEGAVAAARFYQGFAYRLAGRPDRTAVVIKPVLAKPRFLRVGFLARLEYCRALGSRGEYAAALVLCMRLGVLADEWFADEPTAVQAAAQATTLAVRIKLMQQWAEAVEADGDKEEAGEIRQQVQQLRKKRGNPNPADAWLRLDKAIPGAA